MKHLLEGLLLTLALALCYWVGSSGPLFCVPESKGASAPAPTVKVTVPPAHHEPYSNDPWVVTRMLILDQIDAVEATYRERRCLPQDVCSMPIDAWGHPLRYTWVGPAWFQVSSAGEDGIWETDDDQVRSANNLGLTPLMNWCPGTM